MEVTINPASKPYKRHIGENRYPVTFKVPHYWFGWIPDQARNDEIHSIFSGRIK